MAHTSLPVSVRLSPDALHLEVLLAPDAPLLRTDALVVLIQEQSARLNVHMPLTARDLDARLRSSRRGAWITLLSGTPPTPPVDGRVELLAPIPVVTERGARTGPLGTAAGQPTIQGMRHAVLAGTVLARLRAGRPGAPGCDLLGHPITPRPARAAHLPRGDNTRVGDGGAALLAACDGEVVLRQLLIHVIPMHVHEGDLTAADGPLISERGVFITGSVRDTRVAARGEVYVAGDVRSSRVVSERAGVTVLGGVGGSPQEQSELHAALDVICGSAVHADLRAGAHIRLLGEARHAALHAPGNLYLQRSIEQSLIETRLHIGGAVIPTLPAPSPLVPVPTDRQHFRVATSLPASLALHGAGPLAFYPCSIVDMSTSGARCRLSGEAPSPGSIVHLKLALPGNDEQMLVVARVSRAVGPTQIGLTFLQMTQRDRHRLTEYCLQLLMARKHGKMATREDRQR